MALMSVMVEVIFHGRIGEMVCHRLHGRKGFWCWQSCNGLSWDMGLMFFFMCGMVEIVCHELQKVK